MAVGAAVATLQPPPQLKPPTPVGSPSRLENEGLSEDKVNRRPEESQAPAVSKIGSIGGRESDGPRFADDDGPRGHMMMVRTENWAAQ